MSDNVPRRPVRGAATKATAMAAAQLASGRASPSKSNRRAVKTASEAPQDTTEDQGEGEKALSPLTPGPSTPPPQPVRKKKGPKRKKAAALPAHNEAVAGQAKEPVVTEAPAGGSTEQLNPGGLGAGQAEEPDAASTRSVVNSPPPAPPAQPPRRTSVDPGTPLPPPPPRSPPAQPSRPASIGSDTSPSPSPPHSPPARSPMPPAPPIFPFPFKAPNRPTDQRHVRSLNVASGDSNHAEHSANDSDNHGDSDDNQLDEDGTHRRPGRRSDTVYDATRATNRKLTAVLNEASEEYGLPTEIFFRAFLRERDYQKRTDSNWNAFQQWEAEQNRLNGIAEVPPRSEVSSRYEEFKRENENWQEILDAFRDVKQVEKASTRTYLLQQRELEKIYEAFEIHAERAHLLHFEVIPGLKEFSKKRLDIPNGELLALVMTEACDGVAKPTTQHVKKHIVKNQKQNQFLTQFTDNSGQQSGEDEPSGTKQASSTTIVTKNKSPPIPADVVLASGERITISIPKGTHPEKAKYEQNVAFLKSLVDDVIEKGSLRTNTTTIVWARLPGLLAEAGWCLMNYPADTPMPGEVPPGVDAQRYIQQGIRVIKRGKLAEFVWELIRVGSPDWELVKGDRQLMLKNRMPVIIQAPPILSTKQEKQLLSWKKGKTPGGSALVSPPASEFGRRLFANIASDELGPRYIVDNDACAAREEVMKTKGVEKGRDDESTFNKQPRGGGKAKGKGKGKVTSPAASPSPEPSGLFGDVDLPQVPMPPPHDQPRTTTYAPPPQRPPPRGNSAALPPSIPPPRGGSVAPPPPRGSSVAPRGSLAPPPHRGSSIAPPPPQSSLRGNSVVLPQQNTTAPPLRPPPRTIPAQPVPRPPSRAIPAQPVPRPPSRAISIQPPPRPSSRIHPHHLMPENRLQVTHTQSWQQAPMAYPSDCDPRATPHAQIAGNVHSMAPRGLPPQRPPPSTASASNHPYIYGQPPQATSNSSYTWDTAYPAQASQTAQYGPTDHGGDYDFGDYSDAPSNYNNAPRYDQSSHNGVTDDAAHYDHDTAGYDQSDHYGANHPYTQSSHHLPSIPEARDQSGGSAGDGYPDGDGYEETDRVYLLFLQLHLVYFPAPSELNTPYPEFA
ncbi:hypothetical protein EST38_g7308 [Candolleomyces aberdarensis]|uniref:Uncharacterized protein n=1 Tax=Candolleomyces aberdarensis TaxID=2316362 RepID=A0A4Q2DIS3_9AGAR|nr:hypothetical protein EST38_g7308 [Candolleomyces aberdarensis]